MSPKQWRGMVESFNRKSCERTLDAIRAQGSRYVVRIGGRKQGTVRHFSSKSGAVIAVKAYYRMALARQIGA